MLHSLLPSQTYRELSLVLTSVTDAVSGLSQSEAICALYRIQTLSHPPMADKMFHRFAEDYHTTSCISSRKHL